MVIIGLIIWGIIGAICMDNVINNGYCPEKASLKTQFILNLICGPICWILFLIGVIIGIVQVIAILLERK